MRCLKMEYSEYFKSMVTNDLIILHVGVNKAYAVYTQTMSLNEDIDVQYKCADLVYILFNKRKYTCDKSYKYLKKFIKDTYHRDIKIEVYYS